MMTSRFRKSAGVVVAGSLLLLIDGARTPVDAGCNIIPPAVTTFRGALGSTDRPFARPGDWVKVALDPVCAASSPGFGGGASAQVVSIVFAPPGGGPRNVVALAADCGAVDTASCAARPDVGTATCVTVNAPGDPLGLEVVDPSTLRFRFPDTDSNLFAANDDLTFTGPATVAITAAGQSLPCALAGLSCEQQAGLVACIDAVYAANGTCNGQPHATFAGFTALPPSNDYQALCTDPVPPCTGASDDLRFTVDAGGNLLIPMDWRGVRVDRDAVPVARLLRASSTVEAFEGRSEPIRIPDLASLASYSPEGIKLPPLFDPQSDPTAIGTATFFGSTDAADTVLRIARHHGPSNQCDTGANAALPCSDDAHCAGQTCVAPRCIGGGSAGAACSTNFDCPGGECGPGLFDFSSRLLAGRGPVLLRLGACIGGSNELTACNDDNDCNGGQCGAFTMAALDPVPLDGLNQSGTLSCFVMEEAIDNVDLNGDSDKSDPVVKLFDRATGVVDPIGEAGTEGRAIARVRQPPFTFPALAVEDDVIAFLEPEQWQGATDTSANARIFETVVRAYRLGGGEASDPFAPLVADAAPLVNDRSLAISNGRVFFRSSEAAGAVQETTRVNLNSAGDQATGGLFFSIMPSLSADGRYVAFASHATNLVPGDTNNVFDIFVRDRQNNVTTRVSVNATGAQTNGASIWAPFISADGRYVAFSSGAANLVPGDTNVCPPGGGGLVGSCVDIFVHDRDADADGIFDETGSGERAVVRVSVAADGTESNGTSFNDIGSISPDGRFVTFSSHGDNLVANDGNGFTDVFLHDRDAEQDGIFDETGPSERATVRISVGANGLDANGDSISPVASGDGRFVVFESLACDLIPGDCVTTGDTNGVADVFLRDRDTDGDGIFDEPGDSETIRVSVDAAGNQGDAKSLEPFISADGSTVVFVSLASNLVAGDTNGKNDIFAYDRPSGRISVVSTTPAGRVPNGHQGSPKSTPDGRYVVYSSNGARDLVVNDDVSLADLYLHDRLTRITTRLHVDPLGRVADGPYIPSPAISADGRVVAFESVATNLVAGDTNGQGDIFVRDAIAASGDLSGDGDAADTLLRVLDTTTGPPSPVIDLCPATTTAVAAGRAAFLRPEAAGETPSLAGCPTATLIGGNPDLNGDGDSGDDVVHFWDGSTVANLERAATTVVLSDTWLAALVSENANGASILNGDGDADDDVVQIHPAGAGAWTNLAQAAENLAIAGSRIAFLTSEAAQGNAILNDDGDSDDRVVQTYDGDTASLTNVEQAAEELVLGGSGLIAFRTLEARQGNQILNDDGDSDDGVLQVYDAVAGLLLNSEQAVTPCRLEACDPRLPYRVRDDTVTFLTLEADQGEDLNGDGDQGDLVLQILNVRQACDGGSPAGACHTLGATSAGVCTNSGAACVDEDTCLPGTCFVPPGGCLRATGTSCNPNNGSGCNPATQFCQPTLGSPGQGTCVQIETQPGGDPQLCSNDADCTAPAYCSQGAQAFNRLLDPLSEDDDSLVFTGVGVCSEDLLTACVSSAQCGDQQVCDSGTCHRWHGVCSNDDDCPGNIPTCRADLVRATAIDSDRDELPDFIDNCPEAANVHQQDGDGDGVGDACDAETCGNGIAEGSEECDDGNTGGGDGCEADCSLAPTFVSGVKVIFKDNPGSNERLLLFLSKDQANLVAPTGPLQDPTIGGASIQMLNPTTGERATIDLAAINWSGLGKPAGAKGYKYRDPEQAAGPCKTAILKPGKVLKAICRGSDIPFTLNESQQGSLQVSLRSGAGIGALKFCSSFGGTIVKDRPATDKPGLFKAKNASAPTTCPR